MSNCSACLHEIYFTNYIKSVIMCNPSSRVILHLFNTFIFHNPFICRNPFIFRNPLIFRNPYICLVLKSFVIILYLFDHLFFVVLWSFVIKFSFIAKLHFYCTISELKKCFKEFGWNYRKHEIKMNLCTLRARVC